MPPWWDPVDVTSWVRYAPESRGPRRPKFWLQDPNGDLWLRKQPPPPDPERPNTARRSEPAIELLALELARRAGIPVATAKPATWAEERGIISLRFHDSDEQHHPGTELLGLPSESGSSPEAKQRRNDGRASATLERVREKLLELEQVHAAELIKPFTRILVVDAWLGNGDRHSGNWALITGPRGARLAPMYDPTACLGVELTDERPELGASTNELLSRYCDRCPSGFGGGADGRPGIPMREVLGRLAAWPEWPIAVSELKPVLTQLVAESERLMDEIPEAWLSAPRKQFAILVLRRRVTVFE
ncbi:MAG: HipA domain-containing protein [Deltaproteobacteria bacterium]|nr:MAG: HipA domain-containing protein [Deltaproteobacteria bacterium]TMQ27833.1 MAG: HipA domain-containing protein [Deltaproteobacteria bacterium]